MGIKRLRATEHDEQCIFVDWLRLRGIRFFSVPNGAVLGGCNRYAIATKLRKEGLLPGAPDLILIDPAPRTGQPVAVEMKRGRGGVLSKKQELVVDDMESAGWHVMVFQGAKEAIEHMKMLGY